MLDDEFEALYLQWADRLIASLRLLGADRLLAQDICQESFMVLFLNWSRVRYHKPYLYGVAVRRLRRLQIQQRQNGDLYADVPEQLGHEDLPAQICDALDAVALLRRLPRREREVVVLRIMGDFSEADTARALQIAPGTVKGYKAAGLERLRELTGLDWEGGAL